jgi:hypothetical protein
MLCEECVRLRAESQRLNRAYLAAVESADEAYGVSAESFARLRAALNGAWLEADLAWRELERHQRGHQKAN